MLAGGIYFCLKITTGASVLWQYFLEWRSGPFEANAEKLKTYLTASEQKFVFNPDDATHFKILKFGDDGSISKNPNENEFAWRIVKLSKDGPAHLEFYTKEVWEKRGQNNALQPYSLFRFHRRRLMWVMVNRIKDGGPVLNLSLIHI